jgi:hypothetical protein
MAKNVRTRVRDAADAWLKEEKVVGPLEVLVSRLAQGTSKGSGSSDPGRAEVAFAGLSAFS